MEDVRWQNVPSGGLLLTLAMKEFVVPASLRESLLQQMGFTSDKMRVNSKEEALQQCPHAAVTQLKQSRMFLAMPTLEAVNEGVQQLPGLQIEQAEC